MSTMLIKFTWQAIYEDLYDELQNCRGTKSGCYDIDFDKICIYIPYNIFHLKNWENYISRRAKDFLLQ